SVFIFAYLFTWIPYIRNLMISHRMKKAMPSCTECRTAAPEHARFCPGCGAQMAPLVIPE
ncbi:MAG TPA: hypothetical protein VMZ27_03625, partial [Candidatus Saccharimonadales bacterium]|nr:hypothetical protein [Candidatus Saccharimonadales bacterium]